MPALALVVTGSVIGSAAYLLMAWFVLRRRTAPAAGALLVVLLAILVWTVAYAVQLTTRTVAADQAWSNLKYVGVVTLPPALLAFAVGHTGRGRRLPRWTVLLLAVEPVLVLALLFTPALRPLFLRYSPQDLAATGPSDGPITVLSGPLFWPHAVYCYVVLVGALGLLCGRLLRIAQPYRRSALVVVAAATTPLAGNLLYNVGVVAIDPTPFLFVVLAVVLVWGFFRLNLVDLVPVARGTVVEQLTDGVVVLDAYDRVVDLNPAAAALIGATRRGVIGRECAEVFPPATRVFARHRPGDTTTVDVALEASVDRAVHRRPADLGPLHLALELTSLFDRRGAEAGRTLVLRDVTERTATERRLRELLDAEKHLAAVLQTSLRPASLPTLPGLRTAARWIPSGEGSGVSGDFFDVHQTHGGDWAFVLGDVAGKGVHAAVVTSMARYTVRTLSAQGWAPRQVLEQLNQALVTETETERFCTVVYGRLTARADGGPGVRLTVALGGHPAPLVRRADGTVEPVGRPGTVLGVVPAVDIAEVSVDLRPGDLVVAFTDGVTEARRAGEEFGDERLTHTLAAADTRQPDVVADLVVAEVTAFSVHRDDLAVLVLGVC